MIYDFHSCTSVIYHLNFNAVFKQCIINIRKTGGKICRRCCWYGYSGAWGKLIHEKNQKQKISWHCPFNDDIRLDFSLTVRSWLSTTSRGAARDRRGSRRLNRITSSQVRCNEGFEGKGAKQRKTLLSFCQCGGSGSRSSTSVKNFPPRSLPFIKDSKIFQISERKFKFL